MRRNAFVDIANALVDKLLAWHFSGDLEKLSVLPDGAVELDLIRGRATHSVTGSIVLEANAELLEWLRARFDGLGLSIEALQAASVRADYRTDRIPTNRSKVISFDWRGQCRLATSEREYVSRVAERHIYHTRVAT